MSGLYSIAYLCIQSRCHASVLAHWNQAFTLAIDPTNCIHAKASRAETNSIQSQPSSYSPVSCLSYTVDLLPSLLARTLLYLLFSPHPFAIEFIPSNSADRKLQEPRSVGGGRPLCTQRY
jgi:hypothetical protein